MNATVAMLTARSLLGRRRLLVLMLIPAVLLAVAVVARLLAGADPAVAAGLLGGLALGTIVPLLGLIAGTGAIGPEIDDGAIVYLLAKPLSRHRIVVTKVAVAVAVSTAFAAVPTLLAGWILVGSADRIALSFGLGALVAGVAYAALFTLLAVLTRNAFVIGLLYALVWEALIGQSVPGAQLLSVQQWAQAVTQGALGAAAEPVGVDAAVALTPAVLALIGTTVAATWYGGRRLRSLRLTGEE